MPGTTTGAEAMTSVVTITSSYGVTDHMKQVDKEQQSNEARVKISKPTDSKEAVDGDSSATCSADEDANMQDVSVSVLFHYFKFELHSRIYEQVSYLV